MRMTDTDFLAEARRALERVVPGAPLEPVVALGSGLDHNAYLVGHGFVLRVAADADAEREARLLRLLAKRCPVAVPKPVASGSSWLIYPSLLGVPLIDVSAERRAELAAPVAATLGRVLGCLWAIPARAVDGLVPDDDTPLEDWRDEAVALLDEIRDAVPAPARRGVDAFLSGPVPERASARVFSHNDLGMEHVLVDQNFGRVTGIIDWSDAAIVDPAKDLGLILRDLGAPAFDIALRLCGSMLPTREALAERAAFYARCLTIEDLAHGLRSGQAKYIDASRAAIVRFFGERHP